MDQYIKILLTRYDGDVSSLLITDFVVMSLRIHCERVSRTEAPLSRAKI